MERKVYLLMILEFKIEVIKNERRGVDYLATQEGFTEKIKQVDIKVIGVGDNGISKSNEISQG